MPLTRRTAFAMLLCSAAGCDLFRSLNTGDSGMSSVFSDRRSGVAPNSASRPVLQMARMESCVPRGPRDDTRILKLAWEELDECGPMNPEQRSRLNDAGLRTGVAGHSTPWILTKLARESSREFHPRTMQALPAVASESSSDNRFGQAFPLMEGANSYIDIQSDLDLPRELLQQIPQLKSLREAGNVRCTMEVHIQEISEAWVKVRLLPIIFTGRATTRLTIVDQQEQLPVRQNMFPIYELQIDYQLMPGEIIVVGRTAADNPHTIGRLFFGPDTGSSGRETLLMIQLTGIDQLQGQSDPGFVPGQYNK